MEIKSDLMLRVNTVSISEVKLRHPATDGHLQTGQYEVEITDPTIGSFALTDDCIIEIKGIKGALRTWHRITLNELIVILTPR